ncbi:MAG: pyridoxal phosphate-dependent aminotransferase [Ignisphaera sp.]
MHPLRQAPTSAIRDVIDFLRGETGFIYTAKARELSKKGFKVINFGVGQPDFPTPKHIVEEAKKALDDGFTGYTEVAGIPELRQAIAEYLNERYGSDVKPDEVIVTPGAKAALFLAFAAYIRPGDEVIIPDPSYYVYPEITKFLGGKPVYVPLKWLGSERGFELDVDAIEKAITSKTRAVVINNPHNPTGALFTPKEITKIFEIATERNILVIVDEIYDNFVYEGDFKSFISFENWRDYVVYTNGLSKTFSMTGWRLGYLVVRREIASRLTKLAVNVWTCATSFVQRAGVKALKGDWGPVKEMIETFRRRRDIMVSELSKIDGVAVWRSRGAFYLYPNIRKVLDKLDTDVETFANRLLEEKHVVLLPGTVFSETDFGRNFIRLSFALNEELIVEGVNRLKSFIYEHKKL